ncbi:2-hydroxychromene-2-carboxylate isomerase [Rhodobacteraceae bacterium M382]|nr:2-hydroxychromene-2-carboxylate isomerase [Rhodobacteraceae bacterium M382]
MADVDFYFSTLSPYTYLAGNRLEEMAARHGARVTYKPLDIMGLFSRTGGTAPKDRHPNRQSYRTEDLIRQAARAEMPLNAKPMFWPTNAAPSSYALIAAQSTGGGNLGALLQAISRACWAEEKDIAQDDVIKDCLSGAGFDPGLADSGLLAGAETYAANLEEAVERGVFGAPFYVTSDGAHFWGQDRLDDLAWHLARTGA